MDARGLAEAIRNEDALAEQRSAQLQGQDVAILFGCAGSGKTTVCAYVQEVNFRCVRNRMKWELEPSHQVPGFEIGDQFADVTQGLAFAQLNNISYVDSAGHKATSGVVTELKGAINRCAVQQKARSIRVVLVLKDAKLDVGVERGGSAVRDFEHVASFFQDIEANVGSVGLILTTQPSKLRPGAAALALAETRDALEGLVNRAVSTDDWQVVGEGQTPGHQISAKGLVLVRHLMEQCNRACDLAEQLPEGEDLLLLQYLVEQGLGVFPVNVTQADQRASLITWVSNLLPVQRPQDEMEYNLPGECSAELERELGRQLLQVKERIEKRNYEWVLDQGLEQDVVNHLDLAGILVARGLLPGAHLPRADLCAQILRQNQVCVEILEVGICRGHVGNLEQTLRVLSAMDEFRRRCGATVDDHLLGWLSKPAALTRCIKGAERVLDGKLPQKSWSLWWDPQSQTEVSSIFTALQMLEEPRASKLLEGWAERLWDHLHDLNRRASECSSSKVTVQALAELKNAEKFLSQQILPKMAKHHEGLRSFDFQVFVAKTEDRILEKLLELSDKAVELRGLNPSGNLEPLQKLQELSRSTELNELLKDKLEQENLEQRFVTNPVSTAFAPEQTEIDALKAKIQNGSLPEDFGPDLSKLVRRLDCCGDLVPELVGAKKFCFEELVALLKQQVADFKEGAAKALRHLAPRIAGRQVPSSGASTESTTDDELPKVEEEEAETIQVALAQLNSMLPFDTLLCHLGELGCVSADLTFLGYCLARKLRTSLAAAERARGRKKWGGSGALSTELFGTIHLLQVLQGLAEYMVPLLQPEDLLKELTNLQEKSKDFLKGSVAQELEEWKSASTGSRGWLKIFAEHVRTAKKLSQLLDCIPGMNEAITELQQKIASFHNKVLQKAETSADQKDWQQLAKSLRDGLAFEESELFRLLPRLGKSKHFREMAEMQVDACCAAARVAGPDQRLDQWQRLTFLMEHLPKDFETQLDKVRQELGSALHDAESKFHKAISENDLCAAAHLLAQVQHPDRHCDRFKREVSSALKQLNVIGEVQDVLPAAKKLWAMKDIDTSATTDPKIASLVDQAREDVQVKLQSLGEEAAVNLQNALEGDGPPNHALSIYAALSGQPKVAAGRLAMTRFATRMKAEFSSWNRERLMQWIEQHNQTWTLKEMPEELKSSNSDLLSNFMQNLQRSYESDVSELEQLLDQEHCEWQKAKGRHEDLREALANADKLERLKPFSSQLSKMKRRLPHAPLMDWQWLKEQLKHGQFHQAVAALVLSDGDAEQQLFDAIESALAMNKNLAGCDAATVQQRLDALDVFLNAAGKDPPYQLRQFVQEARKLITKHRPELNEKIASAVEAILTAASSTERDLKLLADALELNQEHERLASKEQNQVVQQGLDAFHEAISKAVEKVLQDVTTLSAESLQVNVQAVKNWVKVFGSLKDEQKKLVSERLGFQNGLLKWIEDLLTPACAKAFGANALLPLLEKLEHSSSENDLPELSERARIAEKLCHALGSVVGLNFKGLEEQVDKHIAQQKCVAQEALKVEDLKTFNRRLKHMNSVVDALPQLRVSVHVQDLEMSLRRQVLNKHSQAIRNAQTAGAAVDSCLHLRKVVVDAPDTYAWVTPEIAAALKDLASTRAFQREGMLMVEQQLQLNDVGQSILAENPGIFGAVKEALNNESFRKNGTTGDVGEVVGRMTRASELNGQEYWDLRRALEQHIELLNTLTKKYLFRDKKFEEVMQEAKSDLLNAVRGCQTTNTCNSVQTLLTHLAACYMLVKSGKAFLEAPPAEQASLLDQLPFPHWVQMLTLFRFLQAHQETKRGSVLDPLWRWIFGPPGACSPENHLAEMKTGEGKCLLLNMAAAFFALRGIKVDIACYQRALMDQDRRAMLEFNEFLGVDQMIRHVTLDDLCNERLDPIVDHSKALLTGEVPSTSRVDMSQRVLLIDEVDMLFTQRFYGRTWNGGFTLKSAAAKELVKYIFKARITSKEIPNITATSVFHNLLNEYPEEMHRSLAIVAKCLVKNSENWNEPKPELNEKKTQVGYSGAMDIDWSLSYRNKTVFVYQQLQEDGEMSPEYAEEKIGVDLLAGMFSFADLPRNYKYILGVTGTLSELRKTPGLEETLKNDYDFRHFTIAPSIFGASKLNFDPVRLLDNEADWISEIESAIKSHQDQGHSVLVFFKNQRSLQKLPKWKTYERLTKTTDPSKIRAYVAEATNKGKVTLLVKNFGRGLDFQMKESEVAVLQTYLSSTESEMRQIQGRTARKGRYGHYGLILCADHLQAKMGFSAEDLKTLRIPQYLQPLLERKQQEKTLLKVSKMQQHRKTALRIEERTQQWEELLFSSTSREVKLSKLAAWNEEQCSLHYLLVVDNSRSMAGPRWSQITAAVQGFKEELLQNPSVAASTKVSTVCFNTAAHVVQTHAAVEDMKGLQNESCGGITSFSAAFSECHEVMRHTPPESNEFILFFTDGECSDRPNKVPNHEIIALLTDHASRISGLTCIAFGTDAGENTLREIGKIFKTYKPTIDFKLQKASTEESLVQCFTDAATSGAMHCR